VIFVLHTNMSELSETTTSAPVVSEPTPAASGNDAALNESAPAAAPVDFNQLADDGWGDFEKREESDVAPQTPAEQTTEETKEPEKPVEVPAQAEEPAAETLAEPAQGAKEGEKSPEDEVLEELFQESADLDALDPEKMIDAQRNKTARAWAKRNHQKAELVREFQGDSPIAEVAAKFADAHPTRFTELSQHLAHSLVDNHPNETFQRAYVIARLQKEPGWDWKTASIPNLDDIIAGNGHAASATAQSPVSSGETASLADELTKMLDFDWRDPANDDQFFDDRERTMARTLREMEAKVKDQAPTSELEALRKEVAELKGSYTDTKSEKLQETLTTLATEYRDSVEAKLLPQIRKFTGLEVTPDDIPEMKAFKESKMLLYTGTEYDRKHGYASPFEAFSMNESSVAPDLKRVYGRVMAAQQEEAQARIAGDTAKADKLRAQADEERVPIFTLLARANQEFKAKYIDPEFAVIEKL
jgi:hypothetical protein